MNIIDLKVFSAIVDHGTATNAAKVLGMTQPGISKHLAQLENEVGGPLFNRTGKYLVLNEFGACYHERVKEILASLDELASISYGATCPLGSLKLGLTDAATFIVTPPSLVEFRVKHGGIHISLDIESSTLIEEGVLDRTYDIGFVTSGTQRNARLAEHELYSDSIDAIMSPDHAIARRRTVEPEELANYPLIISPRRRRTRAIIDRAFADRGIRIGDTIDVYIHTAAMQLAEAGLGIALLPRMFIMKEIRRYRCAHLKIAGDPIRRTLAMVHRAGEPLSTAAEHFRSIIMDQVKAST